MARSEAVQVEAAVFDLIHFRRYTMDNRELEIEIIGLFRSQLPSLVRQMKRAIDPYDWRLAAHTLKGSARAVGAIRIADQAAELECIALEVPAKRDAQLRLLEASICEFEREANRLYS